MGQQRIDPKEKELSYREERQKEKERKKFEKMKNTKPLRKTKLNNYGARTKKEKESGKSQRELFEKIRETRPLICAYCGKQITQFDWSCFAHIVPKGRYARFKFCEQNIALVHGIFELKDETGRTYTCHSDLDSLISKNKLQIEHRLEEGKDYEFIIKNIKNEYIGNNK